MTEFREVEISHRLLVSVSGSFVIDIQPFRKLVAHRHNNAVLLRIPDDFAEEQVMVSSFPDMLDDTGQELRTLTSRVTVVLNTLRQVVDVVVERFALVATSIAAVQTQSSHIGHCLRSFNEATFEGRLRALNVLLCQLLFSQLLSRPRPDLSEFFLDSGAHDSLLAAKIPCPVLRELVIFAGGRL